jgi:hypothetical protein
VICIWRTERGKGRGQYFIEMKILGDSRKRSNWKARIHIDRYNDVFLFSYCFVRFYLAVYFETPHPSEA